MPQIKLIVEQCHLHTRTSQCGGHRHLRQLSQRLDRNRQARHPHPDPGWRREVRHLPQVANGQRGVGCPGELLRPIGLLFDDGNLAVQLVALGGQVGVAMADRGHLVDFRPKFFVLRQQLHHLAWTAGRVEDAVSRRLKLSQHFDQRDTIEPGRQAVEQLRGRRVA